MVVVCWHFMSTGCVVLVGTGPIADLLMQQASAALARETGRQLVSYSVGESPDAVLSNGAETNVLLRLNGDAARLHPNGGSWLSALADWRLPVLLLTPGDPDGGVSGAAAACAEGTTAVNFRCPVPLSNEIHCDLKAATSGTAVG